MEQVAEILGRFVAALQFFVRLRLPDFIARHADHDAGLDRAAPLFSLAGLAIGIVVALVWTTASQLFPASLAAGIAIAAGMWMTGALHEDGLADCADGLGGSGTRERTLDIMRDSRVGTFGAAALVLSVGLRWTALAALGTAGGALALMLAHALGRSAITIALRYSSYARAKGTGSLVAAGISTSEFSTAAGISLAIALAFGGMAGILAAIAAFGAASVMLLVFERRVGGYTGDALGAMEQVAEIAVFVTLAAIWGTGP